MLAILSPSKTQDFEDELSHSVHTQPELLTQSTQLVTELKKYSKAQIAKLMSVSAKIAELNVERFKKFKRPFRPSNARQALLAFRGDVYRGFDLSNYSKADYQRAQKHVRIISGLYGILKPLDLIQPYRLEMKTKLKAGKTKDLYEFWGDRITKTLKKHVAQEKSNCVVNLASNEYAKAIDWSDLPVPVITPVFKQKKGSQLKVIALFAKQARGLMANYIVQEKVKKPEALQKFREDGYRFNKSLSSDTEWVFVRS